MSESGGEIYSLLIPLADARLLVPRACVAEIIGYQTPATMAGAPPWYLGLVQLERPRGAAGLVRRACAGSRFRRSVRARAWWSCTPSASASMPAPTRMVSQGFPQLVRVSDDVVRPDPGYVVPEDDPVRLPGAHAQRDAAGSRTSTAWKS